MNISEERYHQFLDISG